MPPLMDFAAGGLAPRAYIYIFSHQRLCTVLVVIIITRTHSLWVYSLAPEYIYNNTVYSFLRVCVCMCVRLCCPLGAKGVRRCYSIHPHSAIQTAAQRSQLNTSPSELSFAVWVSQSRDLQGILESKLSISNLNFLLSQGFLYMLTENGKFEMRPKNDVRNLKTYTYIIRNPVLLPFWHHPSNL